MNTELTITICAYNAEKYLEETLQGIVVQTMQDFYLLIINDCSTDNTIGIIESFFKRENRQYELIDWRVNKGVCYARHFAERYATTKYMMFVDADDCLYPEAVEKLYLKIKSDSDFMAVGCYLEYVDSIGKKIGGGLFLGETTKDGFYEKAKNRKMIFMQPTAIYNREVSLSVGGYNVEGFPLGKPRYQDYCEDLDLWTRMSDLYTEGKAIVVVPEILCKYRKGSGLSSNHYYMIIKMRYTKTNLLCRRNGQREFTFIDFYESLTVKDKRRLKRDAKSADALQNCVFYFKKKRLIMAGWMFLQSFWYHPSYIFQKIMSNSGLKK